MAIRNIDYTKCSNCGICAKICPGDVFDKLGNFVYIARAEDCILCYGCEHDCPLDCVYVSAQRERPVVLPFDIDVVKLYQ